MQSKTLLILRDFKLILTSLAKWTNDWLLRFNVKKCKYMSIGSELATTSYTDAGNVSHSLSTTDCEKDLGIWINLYFTPKCSVSQVLC